MNRTGKMGVWNRALGGVVLLGAALQAPLASAEAALPSQPTIMGEQLSLDLALTNREGQHGYLLGLSWQFSRYVETRIGVKSYLNPTTYPTQSYLPASLDASEYTISPTAFRPRHNELSFVTTFRYPFEINEQLTVAPYVELGAVSLKTAKERFEIVTVDSLGSGNNSNDSSNRIEVTARFKALDAFQIGAGVQLAVNDQHGLRLGMIGFANADDWDELAIEDEEAGASLRYQYRPGRSLGFTFGVDTVDQFGDPNWFAGVNWRFN